MPDETPAAPLKRYHVSQVRGPLGGVRIEAASHLEAAAEFRRRHATVAGIESCELEVREVPAHQA